MKKLFAFLLICLVIPSCSKHDPILPGVRHDIFDATDVKIENKEVPELSETTKNIRGNDVCEYKQDALNNIWQGDKKIYTGFAMDAVVNSNQSPICVGQ